MVNKTIIIDASTRSLPYDICLYNELQKKIDCELWISYTEIHEDIVKGKGIKRFGFKFIKKNKKISNIMSIIFCYINLLIISFKNKKIIVHFQWLPLYEKNILFEIWIIKILKKLKTKIILTVHNVLPHEEERKKICLNHFAYFDKLIVHNLHSYNLLQSYSSSVLEKTEIIPHGLLPVIKDSQKNHKQKLNPYILCFGGIRKYKEIGLLIDAWMSLEYVYDYKLYIVGKDFEGFYNKYDIKKLKKYKINVINEFVSNEKLDIYLNESTFVIFPYKTISMSGALLKAIYAEKPVIASDLPPFLELIKDGYNGIIYKAQDINSMRQALKKAISIKNNTTYTINQGRVKNNYPTWADIAEMTIQIYSTN